MIQFEKFIMPAADLGPENPMPDIKNVSYIHSGYTCSKRLSPEEKKYIGVGMLDTLLPYRIQDGYNRKREERAFDAAVLENDYLRAVFLPELGGRLWSLYDKRLKKELLFKNPVFQPANLGLRNAWFAGGVEFNVGIKGHNMLTCSPVFCEVASTPDGEVLNLYEYERIRGVVYTVSAWLPENSDVLYLRNRIENREDRQKYMYWWSNIAVPEVPGGRVIVPARDAFVCFYQEDHYELDKTPIPDSMNTDVSYPENVGSSRDFFFKIPDDENKWIAAVDPDGKGLLQCSTGFLKGRKLFLWGQGQGGRNWNEFLSETGQAYVEIQAGLAYTQMEHIPMLGKTEWSWVEAYTALESDRRKAHGSWNEAVSEVKRCLREKVGDPETMYFPPEDSVTQRRMVSEGSGWGALEEKLRGERISRYHEFPLRESDGQTGCWQQLLNENRFLEPDPQNEPVSYAVNDRLLEKLRSLPVKNWYSCLMEGVMLYARSDLEGARQAWQQSLEYRKNGWAMRNIAMLLNNEYHENKEAESWMDQAVRNMPLGRALCVDYAKILLQNQAYEKWLRFCDDLPQPLMENGRIRLYRAIALMRLGRCEEAAEVINPDFQMSDVKEGELSVSQLWFELYEKVYAERFGREDREAARAMFPLPKALDFRMQ